MLESRYITSGTGSCSGTIYYYNSNTSVYNNISEVRYYIPERFEHFTDKEESISIFPFEIELKIIKAVGSHGTIYYSYEYRVMLDDNYVVTLHPRGILTTEQIEVELQGESKKWLESQMKSTWKTCTTSS